MSASSPKDQYIKVGDINTRYWAAGNGGSAIILIHGFGGSVEYWSKNIEPLAEMHRVYAVDMVGFGRSDKPKASYTSEFLAHFIHDFMQAVEVKHACLVGHSLGGAVALQFACSYPDMLDKLVSVCSVGLAQELPLVYRLLTIPVLGEWLVRPDRERIAGLLRGNVYNQSSISDEFIDAIYSNAKTPGAQRSLLSIARLNANIFGIRSEVNASIMENLPKVVSPTLVVWGNKDPLTPVGHAQIALDRLPNATLEVLQDCGHVPQMEQSETFNRLVQEFLDGTSIATTS